MSASRSRTLVKYVVPTVMSSVCFFLFTIIDGIFVGHGVNTNALGAINLVFPFNMFSSALFMLSTIGGVTVVAIRLGRGDKEGANQAFSHSVFLTGCSAAVLSILGIVFHGGICTLLGATGVFHEMASEYLLVYSIFIIPSALSLMLQNFCRNDGSPLLVSAAVIISTICNIIGDWLFIFPLKQGLKGAALATGISQMIGLFIILSHFILKKGSLRFSFPKPNGALIRKILLRGLPESISQLAVPVSTFCTNFVLVRKIGDIGVNAFSIISYVASFTVAILIGTSEGIQPLFGQSYGAKNDRDLKYYFRAGLLINFIGSIVVNILLFFIGGNICALFGADEKTLAFTVESMSKYAWGFIFMSLNSLISAYLYSTKRSKQAIIINILRSFVVNSVIILALPAILGGGMVWYTFGIYEVLVLIAAYILLRHSERNGIIYK